MLNKGVGAVKNLAGISGVMQLGMPVFNVLMERKLNPEQSMAKTIAKVAGQEVLYGMFPGLMWADLAGAGLEWAGKNLYEQAARSPYKKAELGHAFEGARFRDSEFAATMRQRSIAAMSQSRMNARSILGSEARMLHGVGHIY